MPSPRVWAAQFVEDSLLLRVYGSGGCCWDLHWLALAGGTRCRQTLRPQTLRSLGYPVETPSRLSEIRNLVDANPPERTCYA